LVISIVVSVTVEPQEFPEAVGEKFPFAETVNEGQDWLKVHFRWFTRAISGGIRSALDTVETFMILLPWPVVVLAIVLPALSVGGA
jgi:ABC-type proline/glycine betaine transport system permease subunit